MNSATAHAVETNHEGWLALLELATREVFELMLSCKLEKPINAESSIMGVTAMVGMAGRLCGVLSVRCGANAADGMASKMLDVEPAKVGPDMPDAIGEICNMVAGNFKNKISGLAEGCLLSPPTVISGNDYSLYSHSDEPVLQVRLLFEGMPLVVSLQIQS
jgi:chemotaxis protein CheX